MNKVNTALYQNTTQIGFLSIFFASMEHPLNIWEKQIRGGYIRRLFDEDRVPALQMLAPNLLSTFITTPCPPYSTLGVRLNYLVLIVRKVARMFTFEVQIQDDTRLRRRFRFCNYQITVRRNISCCYAPLILQEGWNEIVLNLAEFTKKAYQTNFVECVRIKIYPNCRLRQVYFTASPISNQRVLNIMRTTFSNTPSRIPGSCEDLDEALFREHSSQMSNVSSNHSRSRPTKTVSSRKVGSKATVNSSTKVDKGKIEHYEAVENEEAGEFGQDNKEVITVLGKVENKKLDRITGPTGPEEDYEEIVGKKTEKVETLLVVEETDEYAEHSETKMDEEIILKVIEETILRVDETKNDEIVGQAKIQADEEGILEIEVGGNVGLSCKIMEHVGIPVDNMIIKELHGNENGVDQIPGHTNTQVEEELAKESIGNKNEQADKIIGQTEALAEWSDVCDLDLEFTPINENESTSNKTGPTQYRSNT